MLGRKRVPQCQSFLHRGPCPFTKIEQETPAQDRRRFNISVLNWSDTVTFLVEAEVVHP